MAPQIITEDSPHLNYVHEWFVAFTSYRGRNPLYRYFLPRGFGHVFAFAYLAERTVVVDPCEGGIWLAATIAQPNKNDSGLGITPPILASVMLDSMADVSLIRVKSRVPNNYKHWSMFIPSCVTAIKSLLCCHSWVLTPQQLFKYLLATGGIALTSKELASLKEADITARSKAIHSNF